MTAQLFLDLADRQMASPVKARLRAAETRRSRQELQREKEEKQLSAYYQAHRKQELDAALAGDDGDKLRALIARLDMLTLDTLPQLTDFVRSSGWHTADAKNLFIARRLTGERVIKLREASGREPFDDPLPGDPATPEQDLRDAFAETKEQHAQTRTTYHEQVKR